MCPIREDGLRGESKTSMACKILDSVIKVNNKIKYLHLAFQENLLKRLTQCIERIILNTTIILLERKKGIL